jgi:hypothetical protein
MLNILRNGIGVVTAIGVFGILLGNPYLPAYANLLVLAVLAVGIGLSLIVNKVMLGKFLPGRDMAVEEREEIMRGVRIKQRQGMMMLPPWIVSAAMATYMVHAGWSRNEMLAVVLPLTAIVFMACNKIFSRFANDRS